MGLLSWWRRGNRAPKAGRDPDPIADPSLNGAVEARRPKEVAAFEFGTSGGGATLAGYCPVSDDLDPCRWVILPAAAGSDAPLFRILF